MKDRTKTTGHSRSWSIKFENAMAAVAFAEEGEHETALTLLNHEASEAQAANLAGLKVTRESQKNEGHQRSPTQQRPYFKAFFWGALSLSAYGVVFTHQREMLDITTKGHWYAVLPIITVFFFTFVHAPFAGYLLSCMGIEATKKSH